MEFFKNFKNVYFIVVVSYFVLAVLASISPTIYRSMFVIILSFVLSDVILNGFIHGSNGAKIFKSTQFTNKGHAYLVFLAGIVSGTYFSSIIADLTLQFVESQFVQSQFAWPGTVLVTDAIVVSIILGDLQWRFFTR